MKLDVEAREIREELGWEDDVIAVMYSGNLGLGDVSGIGDVGGSRQVLFEAGNTTELANS